MEYAKEKFFEVRYDTKLNRLVIRKPSWKFKILKVIKEHKLITVAGITFVMFSTLNVIMIYCFMKILQNI